MLPKRAIICAYRHLDMLKAKYPKRMAYGERFCPDNEFYYTSATGVLRQITLPDWSIWTAIKDEHGWPNGYKVKIRKGKLEKQESNLRPGD